MPLFEKINNHSLQQLLLTTDTPVPLTTIERGWLKRMLDLPVAGELLSEELRDKVEELVAQEEAFPEASRLVEKGKPAEKNSPTGSFLQELRIAIRDHCAIRLSYVQSGGEKRQDICAIPCQLEFSMTRREWYLVWLEPEMQMRRPITTPLRLVQAVQPFDAVPNWDDFMRQFQELLEKSQDTVTVLAEECYPGALLSVLNAFSCFDTKVESGKQKNTLRLSVRFQADEREYVLQKLRFLGRRVTVEAPEYFRERMRGTAEKALGRYGEMKNSS